MIAWMVAASLVCPNTIIVNKTTIWDHGDSQTLRSAKTRCKVYYPEAPCLKKFIKKEEDSYWAICGQARIKNGK